MNEVTARQGNLSHRLSTVLSLVLTVFLLVRSWPVSTARMVLFFLWMAFTVYGTVKVISDMVSGQKNRERNFTAMLDRWTEKTGSRPKALRTFWTITVITALVKLAVPLVLWLV